MIGAVSLKNAGVLKDWFKNEAHAKNTPQTADVLEQIFQCWT